MGKRHLAIKEWLWSRAKNGHIYLLHFIIKDQYIPSKDIYFVMRNFFAENRKPVRLTHVVNQLQAIEHVDSNT